MSIAKLMHSDILNKRLKLECLFDGIENLGGVKYCLESRTQLIDIGFEPKLVIERIENNIMHSTS